MSLHRSQSPAASIARASLRGCSRLAARAAVAGCGGGGSGEIVPTAKVQKGRHRAHRGRDRHHRADPRGRGAAAHPRHRREDPRRGGRPGRGGPAAGRDRARAARSRRCARPRPRCARRASSCATRRSTWSAATSSSAAAPRRPRSATRRRRASRARAGAGWRAPGARCDTLSTQLSYATVTSPLAGRVLDVLVEEGSAVSPVTAVTGGTLLLSLAATETLHLRGLVDENEVARVALGQPARIRTEAFPNRVFQGRGARDRAARPAHAERHLLRGRDRGHRPGGAAAAPAHVGRRRHRDRGGRGRARSCPRPRCATAASRSTSRRCCARAPPAPSRVDVAIGIVDGDARAGARGPRRGRRGAAPVSAADAIESAR